MSGFRDYGDRDNDVRPNLLARNFRVMLVRPIDPSVPESGIHQASRLSHSQNRQAFEQTPSISRSAVQPYR